MYLNKLMTLIILIIIIISCEREEKIPPILQKRVIFFDDFNDSSSWSISKYLDSSNYISIEEGSMIASCNSLISIANAELNDSLYLDPSITRFGFRIKLKDGDIRYIRNLSQKDIKGILFNLNWGYYTVRIPEISYTEDVCLNLPHGKEYIVEYDNGKVTFSVDGIEYDAKEVYASKYVGAYSAPPTLQVVIEGNFFDDITFKQIVVIDLIEFYIFK